MIKFKLSKTSFILLNVFIFLIIIVRSIYLYDVVKNREVLFELIIAFLSSFLSLFPFTFSWYKFGKPRLTDWVKFSTFLYLILNYYLVADKFHLKDVGIYGEVYVNISFIYDTLFVIFVGLLTINIIDLIFLVINFKNVKNTASLKLDSTYVLRNEKIFIYISIIFMVLSYFLLLTGVIGYGSDGEAASGTYSFLIQIINYFSPLFYFTYVIIRYMSGNNSNLFSNSFKLYNILYIIFGLVAGMKGILIFGIVLFLIPFLASGRGIPLKVIIPLALFLMVLYPFNSNYREALTNTNSKLTAMQIAAVKTVNIDFSSSLNKSTNNYSDRISMFSYLLFSVENEPDWNFYKNMERFVYLPVSMIPRIFIPSKPSEENGLHLQQMIVRGIKNSPTPTVYGWAYLEGGIIFVFLHIAILSIVLNIIQFLSSKGSIFYFIFYSQVLIKSIIIEQDVYFFIATLFQMIFVYYFFSKIFFKKVISK